MVWRRSIEDARLTQFPSSQAHEAVAADSFRRSRGRWRLVAFVAAVLAVLAFFGRFALPGGEGSEVVARVTIDGTITTNAERQELLEELIEDDSVKAVIVAINSPGGTTAGGEELYEVLRRLSATKPTVSVI